MQEFAFGPLGLRPDEFWKLTPAEIRTISAGYEENLDIQRHLLAWLQANVMNVHLKPKVTVDQLLGKGKTRKPMSPLEREIEFSKLMQKMEQVKKGKKGGEEHG